MATISGIANPCRPRTSWLPHTTNIGRPVVISRSPGCSSVGISRSSVFQSLHVSPFQTKKSAAGVAACDVRPLRPHKDRVTATFEGAQSADFVDLPAEASAMVCSNRNCNAK